MFRDRVLHIASKHGKESVIKPKLEEAFGVNCITIPDLDTDLLGTFTGEVERLNDPIETLRKKCEMAFNVSGGDLILASEGSFGMHPSIPFVQADEEFLMLMDKRNNLEIIVRELSSRTNFARKTVSSFIELLDFAVKTGFPTHALILRPEAIGNTDIIKGINTWRELETNFSELSKKYGSVLCETDMRAMNNPSRMEVIALTTEKLIEKMRSKCPSCELPGFDVVDARKGLPCMQCGIPTRSILAYQYKCKSCGFEKEEIFPKGKTNEDPQFCDFCNP